MVDNPSFHDGLGIRVHIRTTRVKEFSYIERVAVMIGEDVLEFFNDANRFLLNGKFINKEETGHHEAFDSGVLMGGVFNVRYYNKAISLRLHDDGSHSAKIDLHVRKSGFPTVIVDGGKTELFKGSLGILGAWPTGEHLARDGKTQISVSHQDAKDFALEWQVRNDEPVLFQDIRAPQYPTKCYEPTLYDPKQSATGRRLGSSHFEKNAEEACSHWHDDHKDDCLFDVIATQDLSVAEEAHSSHLV